MNRIASNKKKILKTSQSNKNHPFFLLRKPFFSMTMIIVCLLITAIFLYTFSHVYVIIQGIFYFVCLLVVAAISLVRYAHRIYQHKNL